MYELFKSDAMEFLSGIGDESVDLIITDVAYESLERHRRIGTKTRLKKDWFEIFPNERFHELFDECYRVLKKKRHFYFFSDFDTMRWILENGVGKKQGFYLWKSIPWDKQVRGTGYHYANSHEKILFFEKGTKPWDGVKYFNGTRQLNSRSYRDILPVKSIRTKGHYPTEKPVELTNILVRQSSNGGELIIDPFMGSCPVGVSALNHNCDFKGCDNNDNAIKVATERLEYLQLNME